MDSQKIQEIQRKFIMALIDAVPSDLSSQQMEVLMGDQDLLRRLLRGLYLSNFGEAVWPGKVLWQSVIKTISGRKNGSRAKFRVKEEFESLGIRTHRSNMGECPPRAFSRAIEARVPDVLLEYGQLVWSTHDNQIRRDMEPFQPLKWQWVHSVLSRQSRPAGGLGALLVQGSSNVFYLDDGMVVAFTYIPQQGSIPGHWCMDFGSEERRPGDRVFRLKE